MDWVVFSYSLPSQANTPRVTLWRRLRRLGAISPTGSVYILPGREECIEAFQWLAQEIRQAEGEVLVMQVSQFAGLDDGQVIALFNQARQDEYAEIGEQLTVLEEQMKVADESTDFSNFQSAIQKLQKQHAEVARIDYFQSAVGITVAARINQLAQQLVAVDSEGEPQVAAAAVEQYRHRRWVTRPRPHVDRLACIWLIRRYIDSEAVIRYAPISEPEEVAFDMDNAAFTHQGNLCTFEVMIRAFGLDEAALYLMAEIVHEIDLRDGRYQRPETAGIDTALRGWLLANLPDQELEIHGLALFSGLYTALAQSLTVL